MTKQTKLGEPAERWLDRDWVEDYHHENGNYMNICAICFCDFKGHKRRVVCKVCDLKPK